MNLIELWFLSQIERAEKHPGKYEMRSRKVQATGMSSGRRPMGGVSD
jgi:hypothetical protein